MDEQHNYDCTGRLLALEGTSCPPTRRSLLYGLSAFVTHSFISGCAGGNPGSQSATSTSTNAPSAPTTPTVPQPPTSSSSPIDAYVLVGPATSRVIGAGFAGLSYEKAAMVDHLFAEQNTNLIGLFQLLGKSVLRIGGNTVDETIWNPNGIGKQAGIVAPSDIDTLAGFLNATQWDVLYGINMAQSTPQLAADEIAYAVKTLGSRLAGIELGNEPDLYGGNYFPAWNYSDFAARWELFASEILANNPGVPLTGPTLALASNISTWTVPFIASQGHQLSLITQHFYRGNGLSPSSGIAELISADPALIAMEAQLAPLAASSGIPYRVAETNSFYNGGAAGVSDSYASALWILDHLFNIAQGGSVGANLHGGNLGSVYTPIADNNGIVMEVRPEYYGMLLFTMMGQGTLLQTSVSTALQDVTAYAVKGLSGALNILINNKDATQNLAVTIDCNQQINAVTLQLLTGPALNSTSGVAIQGANVSLDGSFSPQSPYTISVSGTRITCQVSAFSAAFIAVS